MTAVQRASRQGVPVVRLLGEFGRDQEGPIGQAIADALGSTGGRVLLDLRRTRHLHYRVAGFLVAQARAKRRLGLVGGTPYVRQLLRLAGALEGELSEYRNLVEALEDAVA